MSLFATFETFSFLLEGSSFVVGQGSPGTGTSRGKIHGIWVLCKTLLPLLFGGSLVRVSGVEFFLSPKIRLVGKVFAVLSDSAFYPVLQGLIVTGWFEGQLLRYCRNIRPTWVKFNSKDTKESGVGSRF